MQIYLDVNSRRWFRQGAPGTAEQIQFPLEIRAGELLSLAVQLVTGDPVFSGASPTATNVWSAPSDGVAGFVVDDNFLWRHPVKLAAALTKGSSVSQIKITGIDAVRQAGSIQIGADRVNYYGATQSSDVWTLTTTDVDFASAKFTPTASAANGSAAVLEEQPAIVGGSVTSSAATATYRCTLDAGNAVYTGLLQSTKDGRRLPAAWLEFSLYSAGRPVIRETLEVAALGSIADGTPVYVPANPDWSAFDSRYEKKGEGGGAVVIQSARNFNPTCSPVFRDADWGTYCRLDNSYPTVTFADNWVGATMLRINICSADASVFGSVVLDVTVGGGTATVSGAQASATPQWVEIPLDAMPDGPATITRKHADSGDTLKSGSTVVSAIIQSIEVVYDSYPQ